MIFICDICGFWKVNWNPLSDWHSWQMKDIIFLSFCIFLQIGRSGESPIDFIVMDTVPANQRRYSEEFTQSTISRFACRILVERNPPYTARIFAAGFDGARNIFLGVSFYIFFYFFLLSITSNNWLLLVLVFLVRAYERRYIFFVNI